LGLGDGDDGGGVPEGADESDLALVVAIDDVDAFEVYGAAVVGDGLAVDSMAAELPLGWTESSVRVTEAKEDLMWVRKLRRASWPTMGGAPTGSWETTSGGEGVDPAVGVQGADGGEVFGYGLLASSRNAAIVGGAGLSGNREVWRARRGRG